MLSLSLSVNCLCVTREYLISSKSYRFNSRKVKVKAWITQRLVSSILLPLKAALSVTELTWTGPFCVSSITKTVWQTVIMVSSVHVCTSIKHLCSTYNLECLLLSIHFVTRTRVCIHQFYFRHLAHTHNTHIKTHMKHVNHTNKRWNSQVHNSTTKSCICHAGLIYIFFAHGVLWVQVLLWLLFKLLNANKSFAYLQ